MAALTANRDFDRVAPNPGDHGSYPVFAAARVFHGALLESAGGNAVPLSGAGAFLGVSVEEQDNTLGGTGDLRVRAMVDGVLSGLTVAGSPAVGAPVYCATDNIADATTVATDATRIGVLRQQNADGTWDIKLQTQANGQAGLV